jgi:hypothetical protein
LQVVEKKREGMLPREHLSKATEYQLEATLRISWWKFRDRRLLADNELQLRDQIHHELAVRTERLLDCIAPATQFVFILYQDWTNEVLEGLREGCIRYVALVLVELARRKMATRRYERFMQLIDNGGLADTRVAGNKYEFWTPSRYDSIEGR